MALIITLILLGVVTFMAVAFLALSRRERGSVTTVTDTAGARYAADAALAQAEAQIIANALATTNPYSFGLLVSTNYINPAGFQTGSSSYTNVSYQYANGILLNNTGPNFDFLQNLANLYYNPRPPVFVTTNSAGSNEFRFYLDLNRNGRDDPNGLQLVISPNKDYPYYNNNGFLMPTIVPGNTLSNVMVGDPEWIGILERPDAPYGPNNKFVARYAFVAVPIGNALDLNAIHNQVFDESNPGLTVPVNPNPGGIVDAYSRNQGVGSWEINLAAFLADLNTNRWGEVIGDSFNGNVGYYYYQYPVGGNRGSAFDDARALLTWRYDNNYNTLASVQNLYGFAGQGPFRNNIDGYSDGPLMTTLSGTNNYGQDVTFRWAGADNTNHFFTHQELFDTNKTSPFFYTNLWSGGTSNSTYGRYTFYRLLSQLGTDSAPEAGKMNLNYDNLGDDGNVISGAETNFIPWTNSLKFFTNAADRLLRAYTARWRGSNPTNFAKSFYAVDDFNFGPSEWDNYLAFGAGNIPVVVSNRFVYTSGVNRLLQLAANLYDATTNNVPVMINNNYPSVFRPLFSRDAGGMGTNLFISGYTNVFSVDLNDSNDHQADPPIDALALATTNTSVVVSNWAVNVYGVPWIIGAKKGFPNFNKFTFENVVGISRRLQVTRQSLNGNQPDYPHFRTNQMYTMSISNYLGMEFWNSYAANYNGKVQIAVRYNLSTWLTNDMGYSTNNDFISHRNVNLAGTPWVWSGYGASIKTPEANSFVIPLLTNAIMLPESVYRFTPVPHFEPIGSNDISHVNYESNLPAAVGSPFPFPHFGMVSTNRLQAFVLDFADGAYRVIDYVHFEQISRRDLNADLLTDDNQGVWTAITNNAQNLPQSVLNQLNISRAIAALSVEQDGQWRLDPQAQQQFARSGSTEDEQVFFDAFFKPFNRSQNQNGVRATNTLLSAQVPYSPTRYVVECTFMQANDPLVHYLASDLHQYSTNKTIRFPSTAPSYLTNLNGLFLKGLDFRELNRQYQPWGGYPNVGLGDDLNALALTTNNLFIKDPLVRTSDDWDFPTNKLPTIGWLGRVHRGTPWQTVYLKASDVLRQIQLLGSTTNHVGTNIWKNWTGNGSTFDAVNAAPAEDRLLFDLFTTAFNDNATRGTLSVNVGAPNGPSLAAWSAVFGGLVVPTNLVGAYTVVQPAGTYDATLPLAQQPFLVQLVHGINQTRANTNLFPEQMFARAGDVLAATSLTESSPFLAGLNPNTGINDQLYEWLPQQTMGLLRGASAPRYVIYSYGQTLKPAPGGVYPVGGAYFGMVTNYQVVSETASRAVVRFDCLRTNVVTYTNEVVGIITNWTWFSRPAVTNNNVVIEQFNLLPPD